MSCGFCFGIGLVECSKTYGCWNRPGPEGSPDEIEEEHVQLAKSLARRAHIDNTVHLLMKAKEEGGHKEMVAVMKKAFPNVFNDEEETT